MAAAEASFNTSMDSISAVEILLIPATGTPSTRYNGDALPSVPTPLISIRVPVPGSPPADSNGYARHFSLQGAAYVNNAFGFHIAALERRNGAGKVFFTYGAITDNHHLVEVTNKAVHYNIYSTGIAHLVFR